MFVRSPIYFAPDDDSGAAAGEEPPAVEAEAPPSGEVQPPVVEGEPAPIEEPPATDWGARVVEWGGEEAIKDAVDLHRALATREGVEELFRQAGRALGLGDTAIAALFGPEATGAEGADGESTIEELLADPERILTAGELQRILAHDKSQQQQQTQQQRQAQAILSTIDTAFADLKVEAEDDRIAILSLADTIVPAGRQADPAAVARAIRTAHERYQAKVQSLAEQIIKNRAAVNENLPTPLPTGGSGGSGIVEGEPQTLAEAKERARKQLGIS